MSVSVDVGDPVAFGHVCGPFFSPYVDREFWPIQPLIMKAWKKRVGVAMPVWPVGLEGETKHDRANCRFPVQLVRFTDRLSGLACEKEGNTET